VFEKQTLSIARYHKLIENQLKGTEHEPAFGCWKDMKHFLTFFMTSYLYDINNRESIVDSILMIHVIPQLVKDRKSMSVCEPVSLCGKWMPRESSRKHKWLAKKIAILYYNHTICITNQTQTMYKWYRYLIRDLNKYLNVPQVHMCNNEWDKIDFDKVSAQTMKKFNHCFLNDARVHEPHRKECSNHLKSKYKMNYDNYK
jgi:hypothetical protein